jgi:formylglycine-generating enzyme required for sulfatase activity
MKHLLIRFLAVIDVAFGLLVVFPGQATPLPTPEATVTPLVPVPPPYDGFYRWIAQVYSQFGIWIVIAVLLTAGIVAMVVAYSKGWLKSLEKQGEKHGDDFIKAGELPDTTRRYLEFFIEDEKLLGFRGLELQGKIIKQLEVNQVFVSVCMVPETDPAKTIAKHLSISPGDGEELLTSKESSEPIDLAQAIQKSSKLAIVGAAGCGKSTLLQWAGLACARFSSNTLDIGQKQEDFLAAIENQALIPLIIRLRMFHGYCKEKKIGYSATALLKFLTEHLNEKHPKLDLPDNFFEVHLGKTGCLVMLDGVDEVDPDDREPVRQAIEDLVKDFSKNERNRFMVTSRSSAYFGDAEVSGFRKCLVQNLSREQRNQLIENWYQAVIPDQATQLAAQLGQLIDDSDERVKALAITPLMVTIFAQFHYVEGKLPRQRAELYEHSVKTILSGQHRGAGARLGWETERNKLTYIAFQMHDQMLEDAKEGDLIDLIWPGFGVPADQKVAREATRMFLRHTTDQGGLLEEQNRRYGFYTHRTFREYLAGRYLAEEMSPEEQAVFLHEHLEKDPWEEPIHLAAGFLAYIGERRPNDFIRRLAGLGENEEQRAIALALAAEALYDIPVSQDPRRVNTTQFVIEGLKDSIIANPPRASNRARNRLGLALGNLGDPRFRPSINEAGTRFILPALVQIPAGSFQLGTSEDEEKLLTAQDVKVWEDEKPQHVVMLSTFEISRCPVTNIEYRLFYEDKGYERQEFWSADGWRWRTGLWEPDLSVYTDESSRGSIQAWLDRRPVERRGQPFFWDDPQWNANNLPVVGVCWFEAEAYCNWLRALTGMSYRLPREAEWEKAARGEQGLLWPWGNEWDAGKCNSESDLGKTSPVGMYPHGASPCGALDMAGNVWEWCQDWYDEKEYERCQGAGVVDPTGPDSGTARAVRGGSWLNNRNHARCAYRYRNEPDYFNLNLGFRVACAPN